MTTHTSPAPATGASAGSVVNLAIDGMSCGHCVTAVAGALRDLPGATVQAVAVGAATVSLDRAVTSPEAVVAAVRDAGYEARIVERALPQAGGTTCCSPRG